MSSLQDLVDLGRELGYEGEQLREFVKEEQARLREERLAEREERERQARRDEQSRQAEVERVKLEMVERERDREERAKDREAEERRLKLQLEFGRLQLEVRPDGNTESNSSVGIQAKAPSLPAFDENRDDLDSYLRRFELYAHAANWPPNSWAIVLSSYLTGAALDVYSRLSEIDALSYQTVKLALMERFDCTEEGFRKKFRFSRPQRGESVAQFVTRLRNSLKRWVELAKCEQTYDGVSDLVIAEQFLQTCGKSLQIHIKERFPLTLEEMMGIAESYVQAHGGFAANTKTTHQQPKPDKTAEGGPESKTGKHEGLASRDSSNRGKAVKCYRCGGMGHKSYACQSDVKGKKITQASVCHISELERKSSDQSSVVPEVLGCGHKVEVVSVLANMPVLPGTMCGQEVDVLRDTGCSSVVVRKSLVPSDCFTGKQSLVRLADGQMTAYPLAKVSVKTPYFSGGVTAVCMDNPVYDLIIGNIVGATPLQDVPKEEAAAVTTRAAAKREAIPRKKLKVLELTDNLRVDCEMMKSEQEEDEGLRRWITAAREGKPLNKQGKTIAVLEKGLLYRIYIEEDKQCKQLVLPRKFRETVMQMAHDSTFGGHLGMVKTLGKIQSEFAWPGMISDIKRFCRSCDTCQKTVPRGKVGKVPLGEMPLIDVPFKRVAVDIVGPIEPRSTDGNRYILTMVDYATRYPEAIPLPSIETERVAEALLEMFSRVGIPEEMITDRGSQFTSQMMAEVRRLLSIQHLMTTPYHAMGNGLVEKYNGTLKSMLKRMCQEQPKLWDRYLPAVLFAYREAPQVSLGFSPFELIYGRSVRGPLTILRELWDKPADNEVRTTYQYVFNLREKLEETCKLAQEELRKSQSRYKLYYDRKATDRKFKVGDEVLLMLPTAHNKLLLQWKGPYVVVERKGPMDYIIDINGTRKIFHANMLKQYFPRQTTSKVEDCTVAVLEEEEPDTSPIMPPSTERKETWRFVRVNQELTESQQIEVSDLLQEFDSVMSDVPGKTTVIEHKISLQQNEIVRTRPYSIPYSLRSEVNKEILSMEAAGIIERSDSPYQSPMVVVKKPDKSNRICLDFRKLNCLTVFDSEPMPDPEQIFANLAGSKYFTKIDLSKGYWQVPLEKNSKEYTAFATDLGLYQFCVVPFGLVNAPATFNRLMRLIFQGMIGVHHFLDDILVYSSTWDEHLIILRSVLEKLQQAGLTARPSKCHIGMFQLEYLGYIVGEGGMKPQEDKVEKILSAARPTTKKELRSFLGLSGYYRRFIPHYSTVAAPLTNLVKKQQPNKLPWTDEHQRAFDSLKKSIATPPVLKLPNLDQEFLLRTDASGTGLGAVLLQEVEGIKKPIAYASRKLLPRERRYAVVERECLAIIWGIQKFGVYLYGKTFVLEVDHKPLIYLQQSKTLNPRLMRWALLLQPYVVNIKFIKGSENVGADFLSRL